MNLYLTCIHCHNIIMMIIIIIIIYNNVIENLKRYYIRLIINKSIFTFCCYLFLRRNPIHPRARIRVRKECVFATSADVSILDVLDLSPSSTNRYQDGDRDAQSDASLSVKRYERWNRYGGSFEWVQCRKFYGVKDDKKKKRSPVRLCNSRIVHLTFD